LANGHFGERLVEIARRHGFQLLDRIGSGGMGEVYLAKRVGAFGFEKHVVVKRLPEHFTGNAEFRDALVQEANLMVRLDHPNIVQIFDLIADRGEYLMVLEFVDGYSLRPILSHAAHHGTELPDRFVLAVALDALRALSYAHTFDDGDRRSPVVHCDVSPDNLLVSRRGQIKLTDFGVARTFHGTSLTTDGQLRGKIRYVAPEQLDAGKLRPCTDVFALGLVLYELLTLRFARQGEQTPALVKEISETTAIELPDDAAERLPGMREVIRRATQLDPAARFADASAMESELREVASAAGIDPSGDPGVQTFVQELFDREDFPLSGKRIARPPQGSSASPTPQPPQGNGEDGTRVETRRQDSSSMPTVLLVDDSEIVRGVLEEALPRFGLQVYSVDGANKAFEWLNAHRCDAVLADLNMPEMGGLELCTFMRSNPKLADIPILLLTSETDSSRVVTGLGVGADDYIRKGVSEAEIAARVLAVLRRIGGKREGPR
jgi:serine/threonine protein kinase